MTGRAASWQETVTAYELSDGARVTEADAGGQLFVADRILVRAVPDRPTWVRLSGYAVLKDGRTGRSRRSISWRAADIPEWLEAVLAAPSGAQL